MAHDYGEWMSLALDGRLNVQERTALQAHLAMCPECRAQWAAFQQMDRFLASAEQVVPAPGFADRFAARLARQRAARRSQVLDSRRMLAVAGTFAAGAAALMLLVVPAVVAAWENLGELIKGASALSSDLMGGVPSLLGHWFELAARWLVTLRALGEAGQSTVSVLEHLSGPIVLGYILVLILVAAAWIGVVRTASRRWNEATLPVFVWF